MHVPSAPAAMSKASDGEASIGEAVYVAWPAVGATIVGKAQAAPFAPIFAPLLLASFNRDNENGAFAGRDFHVSEFRAGTAPSCLAVAAISTREKSARTGAALFNGTFASIAWPGGQATLEIEAKILAGGGARAGRGVDFALNAGRRRVLGRVSFAGQVKRQEADFERNGEGRSCTPAPLCAAAFDAQCGAQRDAIALHDVKDGTCAVLDVMEV
jgi:hypothetical protein